jgi:hypothetical protein
MSQIDPVVVEREVLRRLDPKDEMVELWDAFAPLVDSRPGRGLLRLLKAAGLDFTELQGPITQSRELVADLTQAVVLFVPRGWAPLSRAPLGIYRNALDAYKRTGSADEAERQLLDGWNQDDWLSLAVMPLQGVGAGHDELHDIFTERWRLAEKALDHHRNGAYDASVPMALMQADGICQDLLGSKQEMHFFNPKPKKPHFVDALTIAGMPDGLEYLRPLFSESMRKSGATGKLTRHGILHGRELGYDTRINSTKALVLLAAVVEWAQVKARALVEEQRRQRQARYAGSDETNEQGRRLDRRGFDRVKQALFALGSGETTLFRRYGGYTADLRGKLAAWLPVDLPEGSSLTVRTSEDQRQFWAWGLTPTGYCFGIAGRDGLDAKWLYTGPTPPEGGLASGADWRHATGDPAHPDW